MARDSDAGPHDAEIGSEEFGHAERSVQRAKVPWLATAAIAAVVFLLDLITKVWALGALVPGEYVPIFGRFFGFEIVFNPGAAFSFAAGTTWIFTIIAVIVSVVIIRISIRLHSWWWAITLASLLGGTVGNLVDRLFRDPGFGVGHVVDFLNYNGFFVGNVADIFIVLSAIGVATLGFMGVSYQQVPAGKSADGSRFEPNGEDSLTVTGAEPVDGTPDSDPTPFGNDG